MLKKLPQPRRTAHTIVDIPIIGGGSTPLLILGDGEVSYFAAVYLRNRMLEGVDQTTLHKMARSIGLMFDFYFLEKNKQTLDAYELQMLLKQFYEARRLGFPNLGWVPVRKKTAMDDLYWVSEFSRFCGENFGHLQMNLVEVTFVSSCSNREFIGWLARARRRKDYDMLYHLYPSTEEGRGIIKQPAFKPIGSPIRSKEAKTFPPSKVMEFIAKTPSLRDRMCWLLIFFGGIRISELMHIFARDISFDNKRGVARVVLADPEDGLIDWGDEVGRKKTGTRSNFLWEQFERTPRNIMAARHPERAGWKGMLYEDSRRLESTVIWIDPRMGKLFWDMHLEYMNTIRLRPGNTETHPYYFVSGDGNPVKLSNLHKRFREGVKRIGLNPADDISVSFGPHSARHFYGHFCASWLKVDKEQARKMMHHRSSESTDIYYSIDNEVLHADLQRAYEQLAIDAPSFLKFKLDIVD